MKKKIIFNVLFVFIFLIFCYISSFIITTSSKSDLDYDLEIISPNKNEYTLQMPFPLFPYKKINKENINSINIIETIHGKMFEIKASGNATLKISGSKMHTIFYNFPNKYFSYSAIEDSLNRTNIFWIHYNLNNNLTIIIHSTLKDISLATGTSWNIRLSSNISIGWNQIELDNDITNYDGDIFILIAIGWNFTVTIIFLIILYKYVK
jgi:hypothetical protein